MTHPLSDNASRLTNYAVTAFSYKQIRNSYFVRVNMFFPSPYIRCRLPLVLDAIMDTMSAMCSRVLSPGVLCSCSLNKTFNHLQHQIYQYHYSQHVFDPFIQQAIEQNLLCVQNNERQKKGVCRHKFSFEFHYIVVTLDHMYIILSYENSTFSCTFHTY